MARFDDDTTMQNLYDLLSAYRQAGGSPVAEWAFHPDDMGSPVVMILGYPVVADPGVPRGTVHLRPRGPMWDDALRRLEQEVDKDVRPWDVALALICTPFLWVVEWVERAWIRWWVR